MGNYHKCSALKKNTGIGYILCGLLPVKS